MYFRKFTSSPWTSIPNQLINQVHAAWVQAEPCLATGTGLTVEGEIDIIEDSSGTLQYKIQGTGLSASGSDNNGFGPLSTGLHVRFHTGAVVHGHQLVGGTFLVPVSRAMIEDNGTPSSGALCYAQAFGNAALAQSYGKLVVWHRPPKGSLTGGVSWDVNYASVRDTFAVLRSRRQ